jgi:hypothetical protein
LPTFLYIVSSLRYKTTGDLADRAWEALAECIYQRERQTAFMNLSGETLMHHALGNLILKAWEAREAAVLHPLPTPRFIARFREQLQLRKQASSASSAASRETPPDIEMPANEPLQNQFVAPYGWVDTNFISPAVDSSADNWTFWNDLMGGDGMITMQDLDGTMQYFT